MTEHVIRDSAPILHAPGRFGSRIARVEATPFRLARRSAMRMRNSSSDVSDHVLVRVHDSDGRVGIAEALSKVTIYGETQSSIVEIVTRHLGPSLVGLDIGDLDEAYARLSRIPANNSARAAVDIALHDLVGRAVGTSLRRMWGSTRDRQEVSWTVGFGTPDAMAAEAARMWASHGIAAFKVKGGRSPELDAEAMRAIRERLPEAQLSLDANQGYSFDDALRAVELMADCAVAYVEEPIAITDRRGRGELARRLPVPILGDDSCFTLADVEREIELGAIGMVSIKTPRTGFTESFRILAAAEAAGLHCVVGTAVGGALSSVAALQFACARDSLASPSENSFGLNLVHDIVADPPAVAGGALTAPDGPGLGVDVSESELARAVKLGSPGTD